MGEEDPVGVGYTKVEVMGVCDQVVHEEGCYGYSIYDPHITYPFHYYKNL